MSVRPSIRCAQAFDLLRRHVAQAATHAADFRSGNLIGNRQAKIDQHRPPVGSQKNIARLDIAMDDFAGVRVGQGVGKFDSDFC